MIVSQITAWEGGVDGEDEGLAGQVAWIQTNTCLVFQLKREERSVFFFGGGMRAKSVCEVYSMRGGVFLAEKDVLTCVQVEFDMGIFLFFRRVVVRATSHAA